MRCPFCQQDNDKVVDSRASGAAIRRRRECLACGRRYTTYEHVERDVRLRVIKKDGSREAYDRAKIRRGLDLALNKRKVPTERLDEMLQEIEDELTAKPDAEIPSRAIGDLVMKKLAKEDQVAYVRFASVYKNFQSPSEFAQEVKPMLARRGEAGGAAGPGPGPAPSGKKPRAGAGG
jgi:transcriptional repressor NrdR